MTDDKNQNAIRIWEHTNRSVDNAHALRADSSRAVQCSLPFCLDICVSVCPPLPALWVKQACVARAMNWQVTLPGQAVSVCMCVPLGSLPGHFFCYSFPPTQRLISALRSRHICRSIFHFVAYVSSITRLSIDNNCSSGFAKYKVKCRWRKISISCFLFI